LKAAQGTVTKVRNSGVWV